MFDYISREAAITTYKTFGHLNLHNAIEAFNEIPAADVRPVVKAKWEFDSDKLPICSNCGEIALQRIFVKVPHLIQDVRMVRSNFCPNCGARMEES
jgi:ribosomal protein S27AE